MKLWRKLLAAVTAGTICLGSIGAMLSVRKQSWIPLLYPKTPQK